MNESIRQETTPALCRSKRDAGMSLAEKADYWVMLLIKVGYSFLGLFVGLPLIFALEYLIIDRLWPHQRLGLPLTIMILVPPVLYICAFIMFLMLFIRRINRRRIKTGIILPTGEELNAIRERSKKPVSWWKKVAIIAFFCWIAIGFTHNWLSVKHLPISAWIIVVLMWMIAIFITTLALRSSEPKWAASFIAALYWIAAVDCTFNTMMSHSWGKAWNLLAFMWGMTVVFTIMTFRGEKLFNR